MDIISELSRNDLMVRRQKLKYVWDQTCKSCQLGN